MEISIRDKLLDNLQIELEHRKNMLKKKSIDIQSLSSENRFLENVKDDYQKHYQYMKKIKEEQYRSMGIIADYLDSLLEQSKIADNSVRKAKNQQNKILSEMGKIEEEIEDLMKLTQNN